MSFWDEYTEDGFKRRPQVAEPAEPAPLAVQNAEALCPECGQIRPDVLFGSCGSCFDAWRRDDARLRS